MQLLEAGGGHGRNDYPVRPMWNSLAIIVALRRGLLRTDSYEICAGVDPFDGAGAVPSEHA